MPQIQFVTSFLVHEACGGLFAVFSIVSLVSGVTDDTGTGPAGDTVTVTLHQINTIIIAAATRSGDVLLTARAYYTRSKHEMKRGTEIRPKCLDIK